MSTTAQRPANRLAGSTSPYLLQHAYNPVDWYPWSEEALRRAREEDLPIFLSIGYAACHWCHVMERESFENEEIARILNTEFVPIKVDREERPDLDEIYMTATQLMTQHGGWPMSVFLTPDLRPFYAGTYFPPEDRYGRPGFKTLLTEIARSWRTRRDALEEQANRVAAAIAQLASGGSGRGVVSETLLKNATAEAVRGFDGVNGGFGGAPKFPPSMRLELLLRRRAQAEDDLFLRMTNITLDHMARGGMYDQIGGGFHRYSVDARWLVPHFEKMLYDNALLARVYALGFEQTGNWFYRRVAREILDYVLREMTHPEGGFYSATDADSEGVEGKFFAWTTPEVIEVLGQEDGELFCRIYDITDDGNFEGRSIPNLLQRSLDTWADELGTTAEELDACLAPMRRKLWERRERRVHPLLDDKVLSGWNGLMIRAFAEGYRVFGDDRYREAAERAAGFVLTRMREGDRLLRSFREGKAHLNAYLEDYAYLAVALLDLYLFTGEVRWRNEGLKLLRELNERFWDEQEGGYFFTSHDHEALITRPKSMQDGATPSGNSVAAQALIRAAGITEEDSYRERASRILSLAAPQVDEMAAAFPNMLVAIDEYLREWPSGVQIPGSEGVQVDAFLSHSTVQPGSRFCVAARLEIQPGYHLNSHLPSQPYLIGTTIQLESDRGFRLVGQHYPQPVEYRPSFQQESLSVYTGTVLLMLEIEVDPDVEPGQYVLPLTLRFQPCDDQQCYPPMEARLHLPVRVSTQPGTPQHPEIFGQG